MLDNNIHPSNDQAGAKSFESSMGKSYAELGKTAHGLDVWGDVKIEGKWLNFVDFDGRHGLEGKWLNIYTSPEIINSSFSQLIVREAKENPDLQEGIIVVDAGGYDGFLLNQVILQLEAAGIDKVTGINVEADPKGVALPEMQRKIASGEYSDKLHPVHANIVAGMPLQPESVNVVISRCAIQYSQKEQHLQFVKNIAGILKPGGMAILQFPGPSLDPDGEYTSIHREISEVITGGTEFQRDFPDTMFLCRFMDNQKLQQEVGLRAVFIDIMREWPMTPESWGDRFSLDQGQVDQIREIYRRHLDSGSDFIDGVEGRMCLMTTLERVMLRKDIDQEQQENILVNETSSN